MKQTVFLLLLLLPLAVLGSETVNINTASLAELDKISNIGPALAQRIIDSRPYSSLDDLLKVKGIGEKTLQEIKAQGLASVAASSHPQPGAEPLPTSTTVAVTAEPVKPAAQKIYPAGVVLTEILPNPEGADETGEWIEIKNTNAFAVALAGWKLQDTAGRTATYIFPLKNIPAGGHTVVYRPQTKLLLNNEGDGVSLFSPDGKLKSSVSFGKAPLGQSYARAQEKWDWSPAPTPGEENKTPEASLPNQKDSDKNNYVSALTGPPNQAVSQRNPWFLFYTVLASATLAAGATLAIKYKFKKE